jgi:GNAT superfamily N-acetyltransferase
VADGSRGRGIGRRALAFAARWAREAGADRLTVGTADSSLDAIRFYERVGFGRSGVRPAFFDAYPEPIWEDGVRARDMIMFELRL